MRLGLDPFRLPLISLAVRLNQHQRDAIDYVRETRRGRRPGVPFVDVAQSFDLLKLCGSP
jgi:hypothetical protein